MSVSIYSWKIIHAYWTCSLYSWHYIQDSGREITYQRLFGKYEQWNAAIKYWKAYVKLVGNEKVHRFQSNSKCHSPQLIKGGIAQGRALKILWGYKKCYRRHSSISRKNSRGDAWLITWLGGYLVYWTWRCRWESF